LSSAGIRSQSQREEAHSDAELSFDGYICACFADRTAFLRAVRTPEWRAVLDEASSLLETDWLSRMSAAVQEHTIIDGNNHPFRARLARARNGTGPLNGTLGVRSERPQNCSTEPA
jgi:hypothetical protein